MAEHRTRYNELLGIPNEIKEPDLYQLLGLSRGGPLTELDTAYREKMSTLQKIRSPKHKSFIEFLKGELRQAKSTLNDARKRAAYDAQLLAERRERVESVLDIVLANGFLTPEEEARALDLAAQSGLLPDEAQLVIEEQLEKRGARRVKHVPAPHAHPPPGHAPHRRPPPRGRPVYRGRPRQPRRPYARPGPPPGHYSPPPPAQRTLPAAHRPRAASDSDIQDAIARKLGFAAPPPLQPSGGAAPPIQSIPEEEPEVVAEVAAPADPASSDSGWGQAAKHPSVNAAQSGSGWGQAAVVKPIGVCGSCLSAVHEHDLKAGAERMTDGRLHCKTCTSQLTSGTLCGRCYQRFKQADLRGGQVATHKSRAYHRACMK